MWFANSVGYMFCGGVAEKWSTLYSAGKPYGTKFNAKDDTLSIKLDLNKRTISYAINEKDYGVAFDSIDISSYCLAVGFYNIKGTEIELL